MVVGDTCPAGRRATRWSTDLGLEPYEPRATGVARLLAASPVLDVVLFLRVRSGPARPAPAVGDGLRRRRRRAPGGDAADDLDHHDGAGGRHRSGRAGHAGGGPGPVHRLAGRGVDAAGDV